MRRPTTPRAGWPARGWWRPISISTRPASSTAARPRTAATPTPCRGSPRSRRRFTEEDVYQRASITLENCIKHGTTRMRTHVELDGGVEMRSFDALERLRRDYAWAIDIELCVFPQEGLTNNPRSDELLVEALKRGARVIGAAPNYDPDKSGPDPPDLRSGAGIRRRHRHASGFRQQPGGHGYPSGLRTDEEIRAGRAGRGRARLQILDAAAGGPA